MTSGANLQVDLSQAPIDGRASLVFVQWLKIRSEFFSIKLCFVNCNRSFAVHSPLQDTHLPKPQDHPTWVSAPLPSSVTTFSKLTFCFYSPTRRAYPACFRFASVNCRYFPLFPAQAFAHRCPAPPLPQEEKVRARPSARQHQARSQARPLCACPRR